tara:strand:+ start:125 stop:394 length:270 start_codon:yes stop_codon:yes gene_type:complete
MSYGKVVGSVYIKKEDEKQKLRMGGESWSINLAEISEIVTEIVFITSESKYRIDKEIAFARGFERSMSTKGVMEKKLIVPIKHWIKEKV